MEVWQEFLMKWYYLLNFKSIVYKNLGKVNVNVQVAKDDIQTAIKSYK